MYQYVSWNLTHRRSTCRGFTLLEIVIALGIFSLLMSVVAVILSNGFSSFRNNTRAEKILENAQFLINDITKQLRTSTVITPVGNPATNTNPVSIQFFDHSQQKCFSYRQNTGGYVEGAVGTAATVADCTTAPGFSTWVRLTNDGVTNMGLRIIDSSTTAPKRAGLVTIVFQVSSGVTGTSDTVWLQTSVSLRDYTRSIF